MSLDFTVVDDIVGQFHDGRHAPGLQLGVLADGKVVHFTGRGVTDRSTEAAPAQDRVFRIASMSKSFTAAAILQLRDRGLLRLDDPVIQHLPGAVGLAGPTADSPKITVRHCLTMSSGLPSDDPWADRQEEMTQAEFDDLLAGPVAGAYAPGTEFAYSNLGYAILGRVVEAVTGRPFVEHVASELLAPLGLTDTGYDYRAVPAGRLAQGYRPTPTGEWEPQPFTAPGSFSSIGGLLSTVTDIGKWVGWLCDAFPPSDDADDAVLSRASRREMQQSYRLLPFDLVEEPSGQSRLRSKGFPWGLSGYGYGLFVEIDPRWGQISQHSGGYPGFGSYMAWHHASGLGVVAFGNGTYAPTPALARAALDALLQQDGSGPAQVRPTEQLRSVLSVVERVIADPSVLQEPAFSGNVLLDIPLAERAAAITTAREAIGERNGEAESQWRSPTEAIYRLPGTAGRLEVTVALAPTDPPLIHTFGVRAVPMN
ncbi:CubicO group peptidase (beta-lactamase class C family) [Mycobacterium frederiksbergense]|uniref:CubicO group peptidase (Beta-lactamase class C family) n=1 Tax=Mycolicibacterium frederiksbergense TaxID=117567 RepID=A0ABT6L3W7_9MYCO|nr:serine hydrolase domain-containing protein [Mycolicibacterium frederiksbergense]MDH6197636.1 CubicO group peptidase (beta-lactamase class C family) [Mycolicibacterium frederiksbergense]